MIFWLLLLSITGLLTYYIVQKSVSSITRTPIWLLWLVMMLPALVWTGWILLNGPDARIPAALLFAPFLVSPVLYWLLVQWGRPPRPATASAAADPSSQTPASDPKAPLRPIDRQEEATLQNCFPWSVYYLQNLEYRPQALICRGQLRSSPEVAYRTIRENIEAQFGDRFLVLFQEGLNGKPFFALVPNAQAQRNEAEQTSGKLEQRLGRSLGLFAATLLTTCLGGAILTERFTTGTAADEPLASNLSFDLPTLLTGLPYAIAILLILGGRELANFWVARRYGLRVSYPYFIPVPPMAVFPFGTFGALLQRRSPVPHRRALFDIGLTGSMVSFLISLPILLWGLAQSQPIQRTAESGIFRFESFNPHGSLLLAVLSKLALGSVFTADTALRLHPVAVAGCIGIVITALNLMPVGQLDGGQIVHAMFGQRMGALIGQVARLLVLLLSLVQQELLLWAVLLFLLPAVDAPTLNDVSELDNLRDFLGLAALTLLVMILLPPPPILSQLLGIAG